MKKVLLLLALQFINILSVSAADNNVLLIGKVKDVNGNPVGAKIKVVSEDGTSSIGRSNGTDGKFDQVLKPGKIYNVIIEGYVIEPYEDSEINAPNVDKYTELTKTFNARKIEKGMLVGEFNGFKSNSSSFSSEEKIHMDFLKEFLRSNIGVNVDVTVSANDSKFQPKKEKQEVIEKGKKKNKTVTLSPQEQLKRLCSDRITSIKEILKSMGVPDRNITFMENPIGSTTPDKTKKSKTTENTKELPDIKIIVNKIIKL